MERSTATIIGSLFALIGIGVYFLYSVPAPEVGYLPVDVGGGSIEVLNQPYLEIVGLDANIAATGFISIHPSLSGAPRAPIGASDLLQPGEYKNLIIQLDENMLPGFRYIALLTADDGDGIFEAGVDLPVKTNEETVRMDFIADPESSEGIEE